MKALSTDTETFCALGMILRLILRYMTKSKAKKEKEIKKILDAFLFAFSKKMIS